MVMNGHRENTLGVNLANDIVIQHIADFLRCRDAFTRADHGGLVLFANDIHAKFNAFITDEHGRAGNQLLHFMLAFSTERTIECVLGIA